MRAILLVLIAVVFPIAHAQVTTLPDTFTLEGKLYDNSVTPAVEFNGAVDLMFEVYRQGDAGCVLFRQTYSNLNVTDGLFSLALGSGGVINFNAAANLTGVFANNATLVGDSDGNGTADAGACTLNPSSGAARLVNIYVKAAGGGGFTVANKLSDPVLITPVPHAMVAETFQGKTPSAFIQAGTGDLTQANVQSVFAAGNTTKLVDLAAGTSNLYMKGTPAAAVSFNNQRITNVATPTGANDAVNKDYSDDNLAGYAIDLTNVAAGTGGGKVLTWDQAQSKWVASTPTTTDATKLPLDGSTAMTGALQMGSNNITNTGHISMAAQRTIHLGKFTDAQEAALIATPLIAADKGKFWYNSDHNILKTWDGTQAITVVNLTAAGKIDPTIIPATTVVANTYGSATQVPVVTVGADGRISNVVNTTVTGTSPGGAAGGDLTGTYPNPTVNNVAVDKISNGAGKYLTYAPNNIVCNANEILQWDGSRWICGSNDAAPTGAATGDLTGTYPSPTIAASAVTTAKINDGAVTTTKIGDGSVTDVKIMAVSVDKISSAATKYFSYMPGGTECSDGHSLRWDTALDRWDCSPLYVSSTGTVGVGLSTPQSMLHVHSSAASSAIALTNNTVGSSNLDGLKITQSGNNTTIANQETGSMTIQTGGQILLTSDSTGIIGIGGSGAGGAKLNIVGTTNANSSIIIPRGSTAAQPTPANGMLRYNTDTNKFEGVQNGAWTDLVASGGGGDFMSTGTSVMTGQFKASDGTFANPGISFANATSTGFYLESSKMKIATSGVARWEYNGWYFQGVAGGGAAINANTGDPSAPTYSFNGDSSTGLYASGAGQLGMSLNGSRKFNFSTSASNSRFSMYDNSGTEKVRIDGNGLVGIGTNNPTSNLHIVSATNNAMSVQVSGATRSPSIILTNTNATNNNTTGIVSKNSNGNTSAWIDFVNKDHLAGSGAIQLWTMDAGTQKLGLNVSPEGNVGIGTTGPTNELEVSSADNTTYLGIRNSGSLGGGFSIGTFNQDAYVSNMEGGSLVLGTNAGPSIYIDPNNNVGIGLWPRAGTVLDVKGAIVSADVPADNDGTIDFSTGNTQFTSLNCQTFQLHNLRSGGNYTFIVQGGTVGTCSFNAYSNAGVTSLTVHMPPGHTSTTATKHTVYSLIAAGGHVYVSWAPGY